MSCAVREDVIATVDRVARDGRWTSVPHLPVGATADQICAAWQVSSDGFVAWLGLVRDDVA